MLTWLVLVAVAIKPVGAERDPEPIDSVYVPPVPWQPFESVAVTVIGNEPA
jgi:hypothetical protein